MASLYIVDRVVYNVLMHTKINPVTLPASPRERILQSAHELFYQDGIRATGIDRVIAESGVAKVTFYRYFPSKSALILEFMEYRHRVWMAWFVEALQRHGGGIKALVPALAEWFNDEGFRGCAFINSVVELGGSMPEVREISLRHKQEMQMVIAGLLPASRHRKRDAQALAVAVDGAIIRVQFERSADAALSSLVILQKALLSSGH
jgi:AcrR family transcriptional regulator